MKSVTLSATKYLTEGHADFLILPLFCAALLIGCQQTTSANIEATVQARVQATVAVLLTPTATPALQILKSPQLAALPYSWDENGFHLTLVGLSPPERSDRPRVKGYRIVAVAMKIENLLNRENTPSKRMGFRALRLRTNQENFYTESIAATFSTGTYRPKSEVTHRVLFEIKEDEKAVELWGYQLRPEHVDRLGYWKPPGPDDPPDLIFKVNEQ